LKTIRATKKLQQTELYKELKLDLQRNYRFSLHKEENQKKYLNSKSIVIHTTGKMFNIDYDFEKEHIKYYKLIEQKINTIEQIAKSLEFENIFITFTLPSEYHPFTSIQKGHQRLYVDINKNFAFATLEDAIKQGYQYLDHIV